MVEPQQSFKEPPEGVKVIGLEPEPPKSFKEIPEGAVLEPPKSFKEVPEGIKLEDDLSIDEIKKMQSEGVKLSEKLQRKLFKADDERSFLDKVSGAAGAFIPAATEIIGQTATGAGEFVNDVAIQPLLLSVGDSLNDTEKAKKVKEKQGLALRSLAVGAAKDVEETANAAVRFGMFGSATTDKLFGKSEEERFRAWQDREVMREQERQSLEENPDRAAYLLSQNPLIQGYVENEAKKMGLSPDEVEKVKQDYIQTMLDQGLTKDQINQNISALGEFVSPVSIPGAGRVGKITNKLVGKALSKVAAPVSKVIGNLPARAIEKTAGGIEFGADKVLQGTEFVQTVSKKIGEYAINDPDTWIKGTANTAVLPVVAVAKPTKSVARVVKDIARQVDVGGTAGRRGMLERAGGDALSSDLTQRLFGPQGKGGVARAKIGDWVIRQSNAIVQPGVHAAAMNVVMGLPDIETAEDLGFSAGTGFGIGGLSGTRAIERAETLIDPRKTMAEKITEIVTPDPAAYRRDEDADIKRFMAQASPEIQQNIADLSDIQKRKAAVEATIASLEKERDAQINPDDAAFRQKQIDGFLKQKEALSKATPETQAEATRQIALAFIDAYDLAQSTGGVAGLRGVNIAVLDPANADQFFRDLYGDSLQQAETTVNLLTGIPSLTETDSQKLTEARQLLQKFQNDVEGAKSARGFAIQEDNTDPNSPNFVPPHLRRINQQGATAVINADLIKHMTSQGLNLRHTLQHEVQHAVQQFAEVNKMLAPLRGQLFDQKIKNDDGTTEVYQNGIYSDEDLDRYATQYAKMMSPSDNGASFYAQFGGEVEKMRAYIKDEILAETAAATGEYAGGTRASLDDVGRNVMDWVEVTTKSGRLKQLKETLRKGGILFDNAGGYSAILGAQISPETLAMVRQYQRGLKDFDGTMTVQQSRESDEPDIPLTKVLGSVALQNKYRHADFFEKEQIIKATAPDGSVTEIVVPAGAKIDPFIDVYRTQGGQLVDANGNVVTLGPEITFGSMPDGTTFETDTRIARKSNGSPIILTNREMKARARKRTEIIQTAIDSAKDDGSGVRLSDTGNGNYRGVMSPAQIAAFMALPNEVVSPNLKRMTKFFNELMAKNDGTRVVMEYQAALLNGKYKALSPKIRDEVPIGFQLTKDGNFALTTISVSRLYDKMQAWADKKPASLQLWGGDTGKFWDSVTKYLDNHAKGEKGETGLNPDAYIAGKMKNKINDLFNAYNAETKQSNPDRSTLPRARGKDNLDIVIRSRRLDRINNFSESPSTKLPINYGYLTTNYMPAVNPMAAPMTAEEVQNRFDGSVTATRVRRAMATGEIDALESELRQMDDLLPTESLQLVQGEDQMPRIQIVSMFDPENVASLEPEEIVSDIDAETEAELAILDAQDGTVPPQDIAKVLSAKLDQLYADGGRSPIIPVLETELEKIYQQLESQAQEQEAATEDFEEAPEITDVDVMNSPMDMIEQAVNLYNSGRVDSDPPKTFAEYVRGAINGTGNLIISPDVTDEQIVAAANDVMQYRQSLKERIQSGTRFENAVVAPAGLQYLPAFHASRTDFDKFNLDFINSGNKEQVYGWGLYFAENRKEIDKFVPLQYQYKVDLDIDENKILDWGASLDPRLNDAAEKLKNEIELETLSGVKIYTNQDYYEALSKYLGDPKDASMQLKAMGFDGIKYQDRITNEKVKEAGLDIKKVISLPKTYNYAIFDDSKIKILDKGDKSLGPITQFMPAGLGMVALPNAQNISPEKSKFISEKPLKKFDALGDKNATQVNADNMKYPVNPIPDSVALPGRWGLVNAKITGMPKTFKEVSEIIDRQVNRLIRLVNANPEFAKESARFYRDMAESATMITDAAFPSVKGKEKFLFDELVLRFLALGSPRTSVAANASKSAGSAAALIDEFEAGYKIGFGEQSHGAKTTYNAWKQGGHFDLSLPGVQDKVRSFYLNSLAELIEMAEAQNDTASVEELMVRAGKSMRVIDPNNSTQLTDVEKKEIQRLLDGKATIDMWDMAAKGWAWPGYIIFKNRRNSAKQPFQWSQGDFEKIGSLKDKNWNQVLQELGIDSVLKLRYQQARALKIDGNPDWTLETWNERKSQPFSDSTKFSYYTQGTESGLSPGGGGPLYDAQQSIDGLLADRLNELGLATLFGKTKLKARNSQEILWALEKLDNPIEANNDLSLFGSTFEPFLNEVLKLRRGKDVDPKSRAENVLAAMERAYAAMAQQLIPIEVVSGGTSEEAKRIQDAIQNLQNAGDPDAATTLTLHVADGLGNAINDLAIKHGIKATIENVDVGEGGYTENQQVNVAPNIRVTLRGKPEETFLVLETLSRAMDQDGGNVIRKPTMRELNDSRVNKNLILTIPTTGLDQAQRNKMFLDLSALKDANGNPFLTGFTEVNGGIAIGNQFYEGDFEAAIALNKSQIDSILQNYKNKFADSKFESAIIQTFYRGQASTKIEPEKIMVKKKEVLRPSFASDLYEYIKNRMTNIPLAGSRPSFAQKTDFEKNWIDKADALFSRLKSYPVKKEQEIKKAKLEAPDIASNTKRTAALVALKTELESALLRDQISEDVANKLKFKYGFKEEKPSKEEE